LRKLKLVLALAVLAGSLWVGRNYMLTSVGSYLVEVQEPQKADLIVVLGGDTSGSRAMKGCELLKSGFADRLWLSGSMEVFGKTESTLAAEFLTSQGCTVDKVTPLQNRVDSTRDESIVIGKLMREQGIRKYLLVTSNYHTRRSGKVFREMSPELEAVVVSADNSDFPVGQWWKFRHSRRTAFYEWLKTISYWIGL
jgi:uncharacterized SAM-binding protein YcdF (DUF218 family)